MRRISLVCNACNSLDWSVMEIAEMLRRKIVPPSASCQPPVVSLMAAVYAPATWPNILSSSIVSGRAAQLTMAQGLLARELLLWIRRASILFPTSVPPVISTVLSDLAMASNRASDGSAEGGLSNWSLTRLNCALYLLDLCKRAAAACTDLMRSSLLNGLEKNPVTPIFKS